MVRRLIKLAAAAGLVGAAVYVIARAAKATPAQVVAVASAPWVEPVGGACPSSHPVKGKLKSKIFHLPGMLNYDRTSPDRCYLDAAAAEGDGLRAAKR